jgi:hypothetical protein
MATINRLYNPTPFPVDWEWHAGIHIKIESDGYYDLTNQQNVDFTPGQPGSEPIKNLMDELGIFIRNPDLSYESQALEALNACIRLKTTQLNESVNTIRGQRAAKGIMDNPEALEETFRQMGITALREKVEKLKVRARKFEVAVQAQGTAKATKTVDLTRTLIFTKPPKVFETAFAMSVYLDEHPELKAQYEAFMAAQPKG